MTLVIAPPPDYQLYTAATPSVMVAPAVLHDPVMPLDEAEEVMDYSPIMRLAAPDDLVDEAWAEDGNGPMGY